MHTHLLTTPAQVQAASTAATSHSQNAGTGIRIGNAGQYSSTSIQQHHPNNININNSKPISPLKLRHSMSRDALKDIKRQRQLLLQVHSNTATANAINQQQQQSSATSSSSTSSLYDNHSNTHGHDPLNSTTPPATSYISTSPLLYTGRLIHRVTLIYHYLHYIHGIVAICLGILLLSITSYTNTYVLLYIYTLGCILYCICEIVDILYTTIYMTHRTTPTRRQRRILLHHLLCIIGMMTPLYTCIYSDLYIIHIGLILGEFLHPFTVFSEFIDLHQNHSNSNSNNKRMLHSAVLSPTYHQYNSSNNNSTQRRSRAFSFEGNTEKQPVPYNDTSHMHIHKTISSSPSTPLLHSISSSSTTATAAMNHSHTPTPINKFPIMLPSFISTYIDEYGSSSIPAKEVQLIVLVITRFICLQYVTHVILPSALLFTTKASALSLMLLSFWTALDLSLHVTKRGKQLFVHWPF
jgi:hypothetical protein